MRFLPALQPVSGLATIWPAKFVKNEPMLFSADVDFARAQGGPITQEFLACFHWAKGPWIIDTRVHMLMPGWFPCIPGWHHDDVVRSRADGQPNYLDPDWLTPQHAAVVVDAKDQPTGSLTQFLTSEVSVPLVPEPAGNSTVYGYWNDLLNDPRSIDTQRRECVTSGTVYEFGTSDFHRGMPATSFGWRFFARATRGSKRPFANEVRRQVQTYLPALEGGW